MRKIYFPRLAIPTASVLAGVVDISDTIDIRSPVTLEVEFAVMLGGAGASNWRVDGSASVH